MSQQRILENLTPDQALMVLKNISGKNNDIKEVALTEARRVLSDFNMESVADEIVSVLELIDFTEIGERAGPDQYGYTEPTEAAWEILRERMHPYIEQIRRYRNMDMKDEEFEYIKAVTLALYRFRYESNTNFRKHVHDHELLELAASVVRKRKEQLEASENWEKEYATFISNRCPKWEDWAERTFEL